MLLAELNCSVFQVQDRAGALKRTAERQSSFPGMAPRLGFQMCRLLCVTWHLLLGIMGVSRARAGCGLCFGNDRRSGDIVSESSGRVWLGDGVNCGVAMLQGLRPYQEDRVLCLPEISLPALGGDSNVVGLYGVFDGHNGAEASELASTYLPHCFIYHTNSILTRISEFLKYEDVPMEEGGTVNDLDFLKVMKNELSCKFMEAPTRKRGAMSVADLQQKLGPGENFHDWQGTDNCLFGNLSETDSWLGCHFEGKGECLDLKEKHINGDNEAMLGCIVDEMDNCTCQSPSPIVHGETHFKKGPGIMERVPLRLSSSMYRSILKEALLRAIADIDLTFSTECQMWGTEAGSTAVVVLKADAHVLVANIGDSKALICSSSCDTQPGNCEDDRSVSPKDCCPERLQCRLHGQNSCNQGDCDASTAMCVKELTVDHHPDRLQERDRIEAAGGFVSKWGEIPRVNGQLAVTRAIGDVSFKKYGVIAEPELTDWQRIEGNDSFLILASDGVFEEMSTQDVCNVLQNARQDSLDLQNEPTFLEDCCVENRVGLHILARAIVDTALERGSTDNLAAVVIPLLSTYRQPISSSFGIHECSSTGREHMTSLQQHDGITESVPDNGTIHSSIRTTFIQQQEGKISQDKSCNYWEMLSGMLLQGNDLSVCYQLTQRLPGGVLLPLQALIEYDPIESSDVTGNLKRAEALGKSAFPQLEELRLMGDLQQPPFLEYEGGIELYRENHICLPNVLQDDAKEVCLNPEGFAYYLSLIEAVPVDNETMESSFGDVFSSANMSSLYLYTAIHQRYILTKNVGRGGFGEVWLGFAQNCSLERESSDKIGTQFSSPIGFLDLQTFETNYKGNSSLNLSNILSRDPLAAHNNDKEIFVLKRILVEKGTEVYLSGMREKYFGEIFLHAQTSSMETPSRTQSRKLYREEEESSQRDDMPLKHIARYVECLEVYNQDDFWLVFRNEGQSLSTLLYTTQGTSSMTAHVHILQPSQWLKWLKTTETGHHEMRSLIYQLLLAVKACHERNITHRDIKPENMIVHPTRRCIFTEDNGQMHTNWPCNLTMRIIDFGSAIDTYTLQHLYGPGGPSRSEQTMEYTPPEAFLQRHWHKYHGNLATMYDMWSVGVVMLELILGTPHVFQISSRTRALLNQRLEGWDRSALDTAYILRALSEMCILFPGHTAHHYHKASEKLDNFDLVSWKCTEDALMQQLKQRDPLGIGVEDIWALRLIRRLLQWYPEDRISAAEALHHPYFHPSLQG